MLKKNFIAAIAKLTKIDASKIEAAIAATEEADVEGFDPDAHGLETYTAEELTERDKNAVTPALKANLKKEGMEAAVKSFKKAAGYEGTETDPETLAAAITKAAVEKAKLSVPDQVKEKETQITLLKSDLEKERAEIAKAGQTIAQIKREREILAAFPANLTGDLSADERVLLFNARFEATEVEGTGTVWKDRTNGTELRDDKSRSPLGLKDVATRFATEKKWLAEAEPGRGGQGGGDSKTGGGGGKITSYSQAIKAFKESGGNINDAAGFDTFLAQHTKDNAAFVYDYDKAE